jgi:hypothetical protein
VVAPEAGKHEPLVIVAAAVAPITEDTSRPLLLESIISPVGTPVEEL